MIFLLENKIQEYAWGDPHSISNLLGQRNPKNKPQAELWMGAHPKAPSFVSNAGKKIALNQLIAGDMSFYLGSKTAERFKQLPFLFKILAAGSPLSLQVHPNLKQAEEGFERENRLNVPLDASFRNYKDSNHKPEIICALTKFYAMNGFLPVEKIIENFVRFKGAVGQKLVRVLKQDSVDGLKSFFANVMNLASNEKMEILHEVHAIAENAQSLADEWVLKLEMQYPGDIGVLSPLFLNVIVLEPGQAMFLSAGRLHSYLSGLGVELMANSDNVLRGGLTPKHVDIAELLKVLEFNSDPIEILKPHGFLEEKMYQNFTPEFSLSVIEISPPAKIEIMSENKPCILFCSKGSGSLFEGEERTAFSKGQSFFVPASVSSLRVNGDCEIYKATVADIL